MDEKQELQERIKKMYVASGEYKFENEKEEDRFVKNAAHYVEAEYQSEGHYNYVSLKEFSYDSKADAIIYGVATRDYDWFL